MRSLILVFFLVCCVPAFAAEAEVEKNTAEITAVRTYAIPDKHDPPRYPRDALRRGTEGWVIAHFTVTEEGKTDDIAVIKASIDGFFEKEAIRTISGWTYKPATLDGVAVRQSTRSIRMTFRITNTAVAASKKFLKLYRQALTAMKDGDLVTAKDLIDQLDANQKRLLTEVCYLDILKSVYWQKMGDDMAQLKHVEHALVIADEVAKKGMYISLLRQAIAGNALANNYAAVLEHYETLVEVSPDLAPDDPINRIVNDVNQILEGDKAIVSNGKITRCKTCQPPKSFWRHVLNRGNFSIDNVAGKVSDVEVVCDRQSVTLAYDPETVWSIKRDWGGCDLRVHGEAGTTFRLIEHPAAG